MTPIIVIPDSLEVHEDPDLRVARKQNMVLDELAERRNRATPWAVCSQIVAATVAYENVEGAHSADAELGALLSIV